MSDDSEGRPPGRARRAAGRGRGAHHKRAGANDEPAQEGDDEVEAHSHIRKAEPDNKFA